MSNATANRLINENSPYLLQHAYNPVSWHPWGDEAFAASKEANSLMVVSIGYSACHWCHVMEKESFEDMQVAALMNKNYISVKIDREERPDIDQVYMQAAYLITGSGGWPLNVITLPDGRPVYAGTYFTKDKWLQVLEYFSELQRSQPELLLNQAENIHSEVGASLAGPTFNENQAYNNQDIHHLYKGIMKKMDPDLGGMFGAPKFPMPTILEFLLTHALRTGEKEGLEMVKTSLDVMAAGGIYDQLGGGFCRYSTDAKWRIPHFEKMLYDNAQLISLYANAYRNSGNKDYQHIIRDSITFVRRELTSPEGGFYSALDADSDGEEGLFYLWSKDEIKPLAGEHTAIICDFFHISAEGNWLSGKNILYRETAGPAIPNKALISSKDFTRIKQRMLDARALRSRPGLDDKILTSWNALMLIGLVDAYRSLGDESYLALAIKNARFLEQHMITEDYVLYRSYKNGQAKIHGFLDDYAFLADAFLQLYSVTFDEHWLMLANRLSEYVIEHFYDASKQQFYYNSKSAPELIFRPSELSDNVIPSSSSRIISVLTRLYGYLKINEYQKISSSVLIRMKSQILKNPAFHSAWGIRLIEHLLPNIELVIMGPKAKKLRKEIDRHYFPGILISGAEKRGDIIPV